MSVPIENRLGVEALAAVIVNFDSNAIIEYNKMVSLLYGQGSYPYEPKQLDLYLKNRVTPPARLSIEVPSILELKALSHHL